MDQEVKEVTTPSDNATQFTANGKVYRKALTLSFNRYGWMEQLRAEMGDGRDPVVQFKSLKTAYELLNKQQFADSAVTIHTAMTNMARIADRDPHPAFKMAMLFWNYEGEDTRRMTPELMAEKLNDMDEGGIDHAFLFRQAVSNAPGLLAAYRASIEAFSGQEKTADVNA